MKICPKCGTEVEKRFCPDCGTDVLEESAETAEAPVEVMTLQHYAGEEQYNNQKSVDEKIDDMQGSMSAKTTGIVAYITWIGFIIALVLGDRKKAMFHINQALVINLASIIVNFVAIIPFIGWLASFAGSIFCFVCWCMGLYYACKGQEKEVPLIGQIKLLN